MESEEREASSIDLDDAILDVTVRGIEVSYFKSCPTRLWLFMKGLGREYESQLVILGRILHEKYFRNRVKNILIDEKASIDFLSYGDKIVVHEVKHSSSLMEADILQVKYYIMALLNKGVKKVYGVIHYPREKKRIRVYLDKEGYREIMEAIKKIEELRHSDEMPPPTRKPICRRCSYHDFCWSD